MMTDSANAGIHFVQNAKKEWTKRFVQDETIAESFNSFVDAQTEFAKKTVKAWETMAVAASKEVGKWPSFAKAK